MFDHVSVVDEAQRFFDALVLPANARRFLEAEARLLTITRREESKAAGDSLRADRMQQCEGGAESSSFDFRGE